MSTRQAPESSSPAPPLPASDGSTTRRGILDVLLCRSAAVVEARRRNRDVEDLVADGAAQDEREIKLLLLGAGESGKSTIFKQFEILYGRGFSEEQRADYRKYVWANIVEAIQLLCSAVASSGEHQAFTETPSFQQIISLDSTAASKRCTPELAASISRLWQEGPVQQAWSHRNRLQVAESAGHFLAKVDEVAEESYVPTIEDLLLSRVRTTGIVEARYTIDGTQFNMLDVGGQRNERRKWYSFFDGVTGVIFVAALSGYDEFLFEDESTNRMVEAISLFSETINSKYFAKMSLILFLNKNDLFASKIRTSHIGDVTDFSDYRGAPNDYEDGVQYFLNRFMECNSNPEERDIYHHVTNATNSSNISFVLSACKEIVLRDNLHLSGLDMDGI